MSSVQSGEGIRGVYIDGKGSKWRSGSWEYIVRKEKKIVEAAGRSD